MSDILGWVNERCDKCGELVSPDNNAVLLEYIVQLGRLPEGMGILFAPQGRHLAPTGDCPGSPSRWQYILGPSDPSYPLDESRIDEMQDAYITLRSLWFAANRENNS